MLSVIVNHEEFCTERDPVCWNGFGKEMGLQCTPEFQFARTLCVGLGNKNFRDFIIEPMML